MPNFEQANGGNVKGWRESMIEDLKKIPQDKKLAVKISTRSKKIEDSFDAYDEMDRANEVPEQIMSAEELIKFIERDKNDEKAAEETGSNYNPKSINWKLVDDQMK